MEVWVISSNSTSPHCRSRFRPATRCAVRACRRENAAIDNPLVFHADSTSAASSAVQRGRPSRPISSLVLDRMLLPTARSLLETTWLHFTTPAAFPQECALADGHALVGDGSARHRAATASREGLSPLRCVAPGAESQDGTAGEESGVINNRSRHPISTENGIDSGQLAGDVRDSPPSRPRSTLTFTDASRCSMAAAPLPGARSPSPRPGVPHHT